MRVPPLQPLLIRQVCLLFWCAGVLAALQPREALCGALFLLLADSRFRTPPRVLLAAALCAAGFAMGWWRLEPVRSPPPEPGWLAAARAETAKTPAPRVCGVARHVQGLPDGRLRVILEAVRPAPLSDAPASDALSPAALPGDCVWTWEEPGFRPLAGQTVCVNRRPAPARGFANTPEPEARWAARGVFCASGAGAGRASLRSPARDGRTRACGNPCGATSCGCSCRLSAQQRRKPPATLRGRTPRRRPGPS